MKLQANALRFAVNENFDWCKKPVVKNKSHFDLLYLKKLWGDI